MGTDSQMTQQKDPYWNPVGKLSESAGGRGTGLERTGVLMCWAAETQHCILLNPPRDCSHVLHQKKAFFVTQVGSSAVFQLGLALPSPCEAVMKKCVPKLNFLSSSGILIKPLSIYFSRLSQFPFSVFLIHLSSLRGCKLSAETSTSDLQCNFSKDTVHWQVLKA
jgi:hypothetical protein